MTCICSEPLSERSYNHCCKIHTVKIALKMWRHLRGLTLYISGFQFYYLNWPKWQLAFLPPVFTCRINKKVALNGVWLHIIPDERLQTNNYEETTQTHLPRTQRRVTKRRLRSSPFREDFQFAFNVALRHRGFQSEYHGTNLRRRLSGCVHV